MFTALKQMVSFKHLGLDLPATEGVREPSRIINSFANPHVRLSEKGYNSKATSIIFIGITLL